MCLTYRWLRSRIVLRLAHFNKATGLRLIHHISVISILHSFLLLRCPLSKERRPCAILLECRLRARHQLISTAVHRRLGNGITRSLNLTQILYLPVQIWRLKLELVILVAFLGSWLLLVLQCREKLAWTVVMRRCMLLIATIIFICVAIHQMTHCRKCSATYF